jgi:hypothetical protein
MKMYSCSNRKEVNKKSQALRELIYSSESIMYLDSSDVRRRKRGKRVPKHVLLLS